MDKLALNAYLIFEGNCREAMTFYQKIFGGKLESQTYGEIDHSCPDAMKDHIMHASLMGGEAELMAGDTPGNEPLGSGKINLALSGYDEEKLRKIFVDLSEGGDINMPLEKAPWGDIFGSFKDRYGVDWMVNIGTKEA